MPGYEQLVSLPERAELSYQDSILGGTGGVVADYACKVATAYTKGSENYREYDKIIHAWIFAKKEDLEDTIRI